ncbi:MAG: DUF4349 domain-containing protein [Firmicutes bacterium]|nr:DUF4349 domain-containing protein [Bacillota bacterium]
MVSRVNKKFGKLAFLLALMFVLVAFLAACGSGDSGNWESGPGATQPGGDIGGEFFDIDDVTPSRRIIYTASFSIYTENFFETLAFIRERLDTSNADPSLREWYEDFNMENTHGHTRVVLEARVRTERLHTFTNEVFDFVGIDSVTRHRVSAEDVSLTHQNREIQILLAEAEVDRLRASLEAANAAQRPAIERQLADAQQRLNNLVSAQNILDQRLRFSTITITLTLGAGPGEPSSFGDRVLSVLGGVWTVLQIILLIILALLPFAIIFGVPSYFIYRYFSKKQKEKNEQRLALVGANNAQMQNMYYNQQGYGQGSNQGYGQNYNEQHNAQQSVQQNANVQQPEQSAEAQQEQADKDLEI